MANRETTGGTSGTGRKCHIDIVSRRCKKCNHERMWTSRGKANPQYSYKCTKCGWTE